MQGDSDEGKTIQIISASQIAMMRTKYTLLLKSNAVLDIGLEVLLIENESCICHKEGRQPLQGRAVMWYHHYLQHLGHARLEETMISAIYWNGMVRPSDPKQSHARLAK